MSKINIVNATAEDFAIEIVQSQPSTSDTTGDHTDGRIVRYLNNFYVWHDTTGSWVKFPNLSDYQAFEADLNTQIAARQADLASLETVDSDLQSDISTEESVLVSTIASAQVARSQAVTTLESERSSEHASLSNELSAQSSARISAVDSEQARAETAEAAISGALATAITDRVADISSEVSREGSAEALISGALATAITDREADVSSEASRAESAEDSLTDAIAADSATLGTEVTSVETSLNNQEVTSSNEYSALTSVLASDTAERSLAHSTIQSSIDGVDVQLSAMLFAAEADISTLAEVASYISSVDLAHDTQTSQEFSTLASKTAADTVVRADEDSALQSALESATAVRSGQDSILNSAIISATAKRSGQDSILNSAIASAAEERSGEDSALDAALTVQTAKRSSEYSALESNISAEVVTRDAEYNTVSQALSSETSTEASREGSLEDLISTSVAALVAEDVVLSNELSTQIANQGNANASLDTAFSDSVSSAALARSQEDSTLTSAVSSLQVARSEEDSTIQSALDLAEATQSTATESLTSRLSVQVADRSAGVSANESALDSHITERQDADTDLSTAISVENSRVTSMLADASILDSDALDTFVELVSFLTSVDTESDDALDSYVSAIDSSIAAESSDLISMRDAQSQELSTQISARGSAIDSVQSRAESAEAVFSANLSAVESVETARHLRINFSSATSLTVDTSDLSGIGFTAGNGMVQVFQEVSSGTFRHLVAPSTFNPSTGEMTFDLGSTAKDGFAVFYSFAGDDVGTGYEIPSSSSSNAAQFQFAVANSSYDANAPAEFSETYAGASNQTQIYLVDLDNASYTTTTSYGYTSYNWTLNNPLKSDYDSATGNYTNLLNWGNPGDTGAYIRWYSQESTDGGTSWGSTQYTDTTVTIDASTGYVSGTDNTSFPNSSPAIPAQGPAVGSAFKMWVEGYDVNGVCLFKAGSESAPYYNLDTDHDFQMYSGQHYTSSAIYWHSSGSAGLNSVFGQQRDVTLTKPSSLNVGDNFSDSIAGFNANYNAYNYGWSSYDTNWALTGTDAAEFDIMPYTAGDQQSASSSGDVTLKFKENGGSSNRLVPASGTYTVRLTASNAAGSDVIWDITVVI